MNLAAARPAVLALALSLAPAAPVHAADPERAEPAAAASGSEAREDRANPEEESRFQLDFFRRLSGGEMDAARTATMWRDVQASPSEPEAVSAVNSWQLVGPLYSTNTGGGRMTGRVRDIDARHQRVLAASGGLWRFNFGAIPMSDGVPATWFGSFATHPSDPNTILLGTGEYGIGFGTGLYKTVDGGATWVRKPMFPQPGQFMRIRYSPDGSVVHAATEAGYFRSTDGGETWTRTLNGAVTDVTMTWGDYGRLFATVANAGLWRSLDAGMTWSQITGGGIPTSGTGNGAVAATHLYPSDVVWVYVAFDVTLYRSQDGGSTWTNITPGYALGNSGYGPAISVCPDDGNTVLYGNVSYNRSVNGGATWTKISTPHLHADYHVFDWDADGFGVWAGHDGGWSHSVDRGLTWDTSSNVMPVSQFYSIDCEKNVVGYMVGGTQDNNVLYTPNQALYWTDPQVGSTEGDATGACINGYDPAQMWAVSGITSGPIAYPRYRTINGGTIWNQVVNGIAANNFGGVIRNDNTFPIRLVTSAGPFVYESLDGVNWALSNPGGFPANIQNLTSTVRVSPSAVLYATITGSTAGQRLYVRDGGNWYERSGNLPAGSVTKVVPHPWFANASEAWAVVVGSGQRISYTADRGVTWTSVTGDLPAGIVVTDVLPNPRRSNELYAGTLNGCYRTTNGGVNWERWNNGMPPAMITEMTINDLTTTTGQVFVVAATYGRSVWKRDVSGTDPLPTVTVSNPMVDETDQAATAWFRATLSAAQTTTVTVDFATQDSTATAANNDYLPASGQIDFAPGQTTRFVAVQVNGDTQYEPDEAFKLVLSNPVRTLVGSNPVATLQDDDARRLVNPELYVTDGTVNALAVSGNIVYLGGTFTRVGAPTGGAVPLDAGSGQPAWLPRVAGHVYAVAPDGTGGWFIGGSFTHVDGHPRVNLAHLTASGGPDAWNPGANDVVFDLAVSGGVVYVAGRFTMVSGVPRSHIAAVEGGTGDATDWNPGANDDVVRVRVGGGTVFAGGDFTSIGGQARNRIAALSAETGLATSWNPNANGGVNALALSGSTLYVGGLFTSIGGQPRRRAAALDVGSGAATSWDPNPSGGVYALAFDAARVYLGGAFDSVGGQPRSNLASVDRAGGAVTPWAPNCNGPVLALAPGGSNLYVGGGYGNIGGQPRNHLSAIDVTSGFATTWNPDPAGGVLALAVDGGTVMAGGAFTSLAPQVRNNIAAIDHVTGMVTAWNPDANGDVLTLVTGGGLVYAGGSFTTIGGQGRNRIAALDSITGQATGWDPNADGVVRTMATTGSRFFAGGSFTTIGGQPRNRAAGLNPSTGLATAWNPDFSGTVRCLVVDGTNVYAGGLFSTVSGQPRSNLAGLTAKEGFLLSAFAPNPDGQVNTLLSDGTSLFVGGAFQNIGTRHARRLAQVTLATSTVTTWNPSPNDEVNALLRRSSTDIYVGGGFTVIGGQSRNRLALVRTTDGLVTSWGPNAGDVVHALAANGASLYAGGAFNRMGGRPAAHLARMVSTALADAPGTHAVARGLSLRLGPNPSAGPVRIEYALPEPARARIEVYDVAGRRVATVIHEAQSAGEHEATWNGAWAATRTVAPGLYFVRLVAGKAVATRRILIVE